ncbi:18921_t:CDS:1, partial [Funneliformis geosporum]
QENVDRCNICSQQLKNAFTGEAKDFNIYELDLEKTAPSIYLCITDNKEWLEEAELHEIYF